MFAVLIATFLNIALLQVNAVEYADLVPTSGTESSKNYFKVETRSAIQVCGKKLVTALSLICGDTGYHTPSIKRNFIYKFGKNGKSTLRKWYEELENEYLTKMLEKQMNANSDYAQDLYSLDFSSAGEYFSRNTRGINEECCHKPCTTKTLKLYCRSS